MTVKLTLTSKKEFIKNEKQSSFIHIAVILSILLMLTGTIYVANHEISHNELNGDQWSELEEMKHFIQSEIRLGIYPLFMFDESESIANLFLTDSEVESEIFSDIFISMSSKANSFHQIRFIDSHGMEIIRVNNNSNSPELVSESMLQNKGDRYYFKETLKLDKEQVYISPIDLNIENGAIEEPYRPTVRMGKNLVDNKGTTLGVFLINYDASSLLEGLGQLNIHDNDNMFFLNDQGYYLHGGNDKDFAFMFENQKTKGFFSDYPTIWEEIINDEKFIEGEYGNFYIERIKLINDGNSTMALSDYYVIMHIPASDVHRNDTDLVHSLLFALAVLIPVLTYVGWTLGIARYRNKHYRRELLKNATVDSLTGLYNRRMIYELLEQQCLRCERSGDKLTIAYVDINDLKLVNDNYGHEVGDEMIISAAKAFKDSVRGMDLVARLGGD